MTGGKGTASVDLSADLGSNLKPGAGARRAAWTLMGPLATNDEFLCLQSGKRRRAPITLWHRLPGLTTDKQGLGTPHLLGSGPGGRGVNGAGRLGPAEMHEGVCPESLKQGSAKLTTLVVRPWLIYQHTGELSKARDDELVDLVRERSFSDARTDVGKKCSKEPPG